MNKQKSTGSSDKTVYLMLSGSIDATCVQSLASCVSDLPSSTDTLYIMLSTGGGSVTDGLAIFNFLKALPYNVTIHNIGTVDSIGVTVFLAGQQRYTSKYGTFLIHRVSSGENKQKWGANELREKLNGIEAQEEKIKNLYLEHCDLKEIEVTALFNSGESKAAQYAVDKGIAHEVRELTIPVDSKILVIKANNPPN